MSQCKIRWPCMWRGAAYMFHRYLNGYLWKMFHMEHVSYQPCCSDWAAVAREARPAGAWSVWQRPLLWRRIWNSTQKVALWVGCTVRWLLSCPFAAECTCSHHIPEPAWIAAALSISIEQPEDFYPTKDMRVVALVGGNGEIVPKITCFSIHECWRSLYGCAFE